jgi:hypothetical protein
VKGYSKPVLVGVQRIDGAAPDAEEDDDGGDDPGDDAQVRLEPAVAGPIWATEWVWPRGDCYMENIRSVVGDLAAKLRNEVITDDDNSTLYCGALRAATGAVQTKLEELRVDDWSIKVWGNTKIGADYPIFQHPTRISLPMPGGGTLESVGFMLRDGRTIDPYFLLEANIASALGAAPFCSVTGWPAEGRGASRRLGERHSQAFRLSWSSTPVAASPELLKPSPAAQHILAGQLNRAFSAAKLARPEVISTRCLTGDRSRSHIWEVGVRMFGGVTIDRVRLAAPKLAGDLKVDWLRITPGSSPETFTLYVGAVPSTVRLANPGADGPLLQKLDWDQAWIDAGVVVAGSGLVPEWVSGDSMPLNPDVKVLSFRIPIGMDIATMRAPLAKLKRSTGNLYVEVKANPKDPTLATVLTCVDNPMAELIPYDFDNTLAGIPFATGIDGAPIVWNPQRDPHVLWVGLSGSGKAEPLDSMVPLVPGVRHPSGWAEIRDLRIGDEILTPSGSTAAVTVLHPVEQRTVYTLHLDDGQEIRCSGEHLWKVSSQISRMAHSDAALNNRAARKTKFDAEADRLHRLANEVPVGTVATLYDIMQAYGFSVVLYDVIPAEISVPGFVPTAKRSRVFDGQAVFQGIIDRARHGSTSFSGVSVSAASLCAARDAVAGEWMTTRQLADILLRRESTRDERKELGVRIAKMGLPSKEGFTTQAVDLYPVDEVINLMADHASLRSTARGVNLGPQALEQIHTTEHMFTHQDAQTDGRSNWAIRLPEPVLGMADPSDLPLDPYILGAWLGDGARGTAMISSPTAETCTDPETGRTDQSHLIEKFEEVGYEIHVRASAPENTVYSNGVMAKLRAAGVLNEKHIPATYLRANAQQRLELLRGLMDTDGHISPEGSCELTLCDERLAHDALELIRSLGIKVSSRSSDACITEVDPDNPGATRRRKTSTRWRMNFTTDTPIFTLPRKARRVPTGTRDTQRWLYVNHITKSAESVPMRCITVSDPEHMYLTDGFVPTHNSSSAQALLFGASVRGFRIAVIDPTKGAADFAFMESYTDIIVGSDPEKSMLQHFQEAAATLKSIYNVEGFRRRALNIKYGVGNYVDLPDDVRPPPMLVFVDEFANLVPPKGAISKTELDDPELEQDRLDSIAVRDAKLMLTGLCAKITAEARSWGIHIIIATQKFSADMTDRIPNGANLKTNMARFIGGKSSQGDRMSDLRVPDDAPTMPDVVPKGRGIWEPVDSESVLVQNWFATQQQYLARLRAHSDGLGVDEKLDISSLMPRRERQVGIVDAPMISGGRASDAVEVLVEVKPTLNLSDASFWDDDDDEDPAGVAGGSDLPAALQTDVEGEVEVDVEVSDVPCAASTVPVDGFDFSFDFDTDPAAEVSVGQSVLILDVDGTFVGDFAGAPSPELQRALSDTGLRFVWLSEWGDSVNASLGPLLGDLREVLPKVTGERDWWKLDAFDAFLTDQPGITSVVWCDTALVDPSKAQQARDIAGRHQVVIELVVANSGTGLSAAQVADAAAWLSRPVPARS